MTIEELLLEDLASHIWDEHPQLRLILSHNDGSPRMGELDLMPMRVWMSADCVSDALEAFVQFVDGKMTSGQKAMFGWFAGEAQVHGVSLFFENYMVADTGDIPLAQRDQLHAFARDHRLHEYPGRVRARVLAASLTDGTDRIVQQTYGERPVLPEQLAPVGVQVDSVTLGGRVFEALHRIRDVIAPVR